MLPRKIIQRFASVFVVLLALAAQPAFAQLLPGSSTEETAPTGLETLVKEAREEGSTVVIIRPEKVSDTAPVMDGMRAERFLAIRSGIEAAISSVPDLPGNIRQLLLDISPQGGFGWVYWAVFVTIVGLFAGWLIMRPLQSRVREYFKSAYDPNPKTTADKAKYLLFRALLAVTYAGIYFIIALLVAIIFVPESEAAKRLIFELVLAFTIYRVLRYGVSWNLLGHDVPSHRLMNLTDAEATRMHKIWWRFVIIAAFAAAMVRFLTLSAQTMGSEALTKENIIALKLGGAFVIVGLIVLLALLTWKASQHGLTPADRGAANYKVRAALARLVPWGILVYCGFALATFTGRTVLGEVHATAVIAAPFGIAYVALVSYGIILILIQAYYDRRLRQFEERVALERENQARLVEQAPQSIIDMEDGEEMVLNINQPEEAAAVDASIFEFQPLFRTFFERAALAIVLVFAFGELGRAWGFVLDGDSAWAALLDIILALVLCYIGYQAVCLFIDRKMDEEGGNAPEAEMGGDGGGAGATRLATLLPIMRYVLLAVLFSTAAIVVLAKLGLDIAPIFAGAGVVGIAVGFGAQTLIRDIFSGAFFLMDDAFRRGEYVEIEGIKGTVEKISIRSFQLRHHLGALHTIPFGEIKQLTNYSRDWVLMKLPLRVTYDTDVEKVRKLVKKLGQELLDHPQVGHTFMQPLKSQGVYKMEDSAMIIRVKFMTKPGEQFVTRKVVYESIQDLFAREDIHFAHKEVTVRLADANKDDLTEDEKKAVTAAARSVIDQEEEALAAAAGTKGGDAAR